MKNKFLTFYLMVLTVVLCFSLPFLKSKNNKLRCEAKTDLSAFKDKKINIFPFGEIREIKISSKKKIVNSSIKTIDRIDKKIEKHFTYSETKTNLEKYISHENREINPSVRKENQYSKIIVNPLNSFYIAFYRDGMDNSKIKRVKKDFFSCNSGIPIEVLPYIIIDDPEIKEILKDKNNPFKEALKEEKTLSENRKATENNQNPGGEAENSSEASLSASANTNTSDTFSSENNNQSSDNENYGDITPVDDSPVDSGNQSGEIDVSNYSKGFIIYNNGDRWVEKTVSIGENFIISDSTSIPVSYTKYDGFFLINNNLILYDINGDYFSDYAIFNKKSGLLSIYINSFNEFSLQKTLNLNKKFRCGNFFSLNENGVNFCAIDRGTNNLNIYSIDNLNLNFLLKTTLINKYDLILSDDFNGDGYEDLLLSAPGESKFLYLKNISGKEIAPFMSGIPFTKPPIAHQLEVKENEYIEFLTFETKNSMEILSSIDKKFTPTISIDRMSMDVFILLTDFNGDGITDIAVGHF